MNKKILKAFNQI